MKETTIEIPASVLNAENIKYTEDQTVGEAITAQQTALDQQYEQLTGYTDQKITELINGAPSTLDTLKEVADAMAENESVVEALNEAIGSRAKVEDVRELAHTATAASTTNLDELTGAGIWYEYNKVCTGVPPELEGAIILALIKNEVFSNITIQTLIVTSNGVISSWQRRYSSTAAWGNWYKDINSNDMSKLRTMYRYPWDFGCNADDTTLTLEKMYNSMSDRSEITFWINNIGSYTSIYNQILEGLTEAGYTVGAVYGLVTIRKTAKTATVRWEFYYETTEVYERRYTTENSPRWGKWEKIATGSDLEEIGDTITATCVEVGYNDNIKVYATICMKKLSSKRCDLHINYKIIDNAETDTAIVYFMSAEKIKNALGLSSLLGGGNTSQVIFIPSFDTDSSGNLTIISAETALGVMGLTGIHANLSANGLTVGRVYQKTDGTYAHGAWPIVNHKNTLYKPNLYGQINLYGATYSI